MKNIFKKNSIIITALAIMIVIAGYLSFTNRDTAKDKETVSDSIVTSGTDVSDADADGYDLATDTTTDTTGTTDTTDTTDATDTTDTTDTTDATGATDDTTTEIDASAADENAMTNASATDELGTNDVSDEDILANANDVADNGELNLDDGTPGDAVLASASVDPGYFASVKLKREQVRASSKETLMDIIESSDATKEARDDATNSMMALLQISDKENATEMLLGAKGFADTVVFIIDDSVDVVVNAASLSDQQLAMIEDIVKNETDIAVEHIDIIPTVASD
jgi:stage III sporulation protein AH